MAPPGEGLAAEDFVLGVHRPEDDSGRGVDFPEALNGGFELVEFLCNAGDDQGDRGFVVGRIFCGLPEWGRLREWCRWWQIQRTWR